MCGQKSSAVHTRRQQQLVHRTEKGLNRTGNMPLGCLAVLNHIPGHDGRRKPPAEPRLKCWQRRPAHLGSKRGTGSQPISAPADFGTSAGPRSDGAGAGRVSVRGTQHAVAAVRHMQRESTRLLARALGSAWPISVSGGCAMHIRRRGGARGKKPTCRVRTSRTVAR